MRHPSALHFVWLGAGLLLGVSTQLAFSLETPTAEPRAENPNVVILRSEKRVTLERNGAELKDMAVAFSSQTGYAITLDKEFADNKTPYHFLLRNVPLTRALNAVGYLAKGQWQRTKAGYHLRPLTLAERATDVTIYEAAVARAADYLSRIDPNDPSLSKDQRHAVREFLDTVQRAQTDFAPFPLDTMGNWNVTRSDNGIAISYRIEPDESPDGKGRWRSESWAWSQ